MAPSSLWFADELEQGEEPEVSRRDWLITASGLMLASAGLFLPAWLDEANARAGALGAQRGKDRNRRRRNRKNRNQRPNRKKPKVGDDGPEGILDIKFVLYNSAPTGTDPVTSNCNYYKWGTTDSIGNSDDKTVSGGGSAEFPTLVKSAELFLDGDKHGVWAKNPLFGFPTIQIRSAGGRGGVGPTGMDEGDTLVWKFAPYYIEVKREDDDSDHKVFSVYYKNDD
jgi:hypothetical protein